MNYKKFLLSLIFSLIFLTISGSPLFSDAQMSNIENTDLIRVGISTNDFSYYEYNEAVIASTGKFDIIDKAKNIVIASSSGNDNFIFKVENGLLSVYKNTNKIAKDITGPIRIKSYDSPLQVVGLKRAGKPAVYRGEIEIAKAPAKAAKLSIINILPIDEYLKGVVPNELPVRFGLEALKAQAVAARNYAIRPRVKSYKQFDICDSVACQVYFGYGSEQALGNQAVGETKNLVALYGDEIILSLYSSTAGGYTESYENAFSEPGTETFPANPKPYLTGQPDISRMQPLNREQDARAFYLTSPSTYDNDSGYFRWTKEWTKQELEDTLNKNLNKNSYSDLISPKFIKGSTIGDLYRVDVLSRGVSGKAMIVQVMASNGTWTIKKELLIRRIFENNGKILPSANAIIDNYVDQNNKLAKVVFIGGGLGHGVGLSQYGAGYLSKNGYTFDQILQHYYTGVSISTIPVTLRAIPVIQTFSSPVVNANLVLRNTEGLNYIKICLNSNELTIPLNFEDDKNRINLDKYIRSGLNEIVYYPVENGKNVKAWIEVYKANNDR